MFCTSASFYTWLRRSTIGDETTLSDQVALSAMLAMITVHIDLSTPALYAQLIRVRAPPPRPGDHTLCKARLIAPSCGPLVLVRSHRPAASSTPPLPPSS